MSFASDFRAAIRQETDEELRRMASAEDMDITPRFSKNMLSRIAHDELLRRERGGVREEE